MTKVTCNGIPYHVEAECALLDTVMEETGRTKRLVRRERYICPICGGITFHYPDGRETGIQ